jgi:SNF2 family DNA or RNA helicase
LAKLIDGAVEVKGSDDPDAKEDTLRAFSRGEVRVLVTKPSIGAWGLNWQHCNRMTFFPSHSYEQYYQAVRRCWRFGQIRPVTVDVVTTEGGAKALENLQRKADQADRMFAALVRHMRDALSIRRSNIYDREVEVPEWL